MNQQGRKTPSPARSSKSPSIDINDLLATPIPRSPKSFPQKTSTEKSKGSEWSFNNNMSKESTLPKIGLLEIDPATNYVIHKLSPGDTLPGLALTYGVAVESIKRQNKIWSTDPNSLFLRQSLVIPATKQQLQQHLGLLARQKTEEKEVRETIISRFVEKMDVSAEVKFLLVSSVKGRLGCLDLFETNKLEFGAS
eukprot:TRINITY_DN763_c0_g2_i3.p1 TRINITY_DN763_c0_g2~~TRINITY_DN763_c0_g2_i3.p1  ORF type:complete len:195 (+),score=33.49 TRINITY_DN763_c0_g2_i3:181-765(+)